MVMTATKKCPFSIGDCVVYLPSRHGHGQCVMFSESGQLIPGEKYLIEDIAKEIYVVVNGYKHPSGGIHWSEFNACN